MSKIFYLAFLLLIKENCECRFKLGSGILTFKPSSNQQTNNLALSPLDGFHSSLFVHNPYYQLLQSWLDKSPQGDLAPPSNQNGNLRTFLAKSQISQRKQLQGPPNGQMMPPFGAPGPFNGSQGFPNFPNGPPNGQMMPPFGGPGPFNGSQGFPNGPQQQGNQQGPPPNGQMMPPFGPPGGSNGPQGFPTFSNGSQGQQVPPSPNGMLMPPPPNFQNQQQNFKGCKNSNKMPNLDINKVNLINKIII